MRKTILMPEPAAGRDLIHEGEWLDLEKVATAELSSEDPQHPFEDALTTDTTFGWRASEPGPQLIRLCFDQPRSIHRRIRLQFREEQLNRSQEIALFAVSRTRSRSELFRQQWVFSPHGATTEMDDRAVEVDDVVAIELEIDPGRHDKQVFASLQSIEVR